jgi:hypothetical protein
VNFRKNTDYHKNLTANLVTHLKIIAYNKSRILVRPPDFDPIDFARERFTAPMEPETKAAPFVMLILRPYVIYASSPESPAFEGFPSTFFKHLGLDFVKEITDDSSVNHA